MSPTAGLLRPLSLAVCAAALCTGCASTRTVSGKVQIGQAGVVTVVDEHDPRLDQPGVGSATVRVTRVGSNVSALAETTTAPDGSFSLRVPEEAMTRRLEIEARGPGILPLRAPVLLPMDKRRVLVIVESAAGMNSVGRDR